jgi:hypothetical protein
MPGWLILLVVAIGAVVGYAYGVITAGLALAGFCFGGLAGWRIASAITLGSPGFGLLGALLGALGGASLLGRVGHRARTRIRIPGVGLLDGILGALLGVVVALALLWLGAPFVALAGRGAAGLQALGTRPGIMARFGQALSIGIGPGAGGPPGAPPPGR